MLLTRSALFLQLLLPTVAGTQALDSDDDPSSPASLLTYLHTKMRISGMPGPANERQQSQQQSLQHLQQPSQQQLQQHPECSGETTSRPGLVRGTTVMQQHGVDCCGDASCTPVRGARDGEDCQGGFDAQGEVAAMDVSPWPQGPSLASGVGAGHPGAAGSRGGDLMDLSSPLPFSFSHKGGAGDEQARLGGEDLESAEDDAKKAGASVLYSGFSRDLMDAAASPSPHGRLADATGQAGAGAGPETCAAPGMEAGAAHGVLECSGGVCPTGPPVPRGEGMAWGEDELPGTPDADWEDGATEVEAEAGAMRLSQTAGQRGVAILPEAAAAATAASAATFVAAVKAPVAALAAPPALPRAFPPPNGPLSSFIKPEPGLYSRPMGPTVPPAAGQLLTAGNAQGQRGREAQGGRRAAGGVREGSVGRPTCSGVSTCSSGSGIGPEFEAAVRTTGKTGPAAAGTSAGVGGSGAEGNTAGDSRAGGSEAAGSRAGGSRAGCRRAVAGGSSGAALVHIKPDPWAMEQEGLPLGPMSSSQRQLRRLQQGPSTSQQGLFSSQQGVSTSRQGSLGDPGEEDLEDSTDGEVGSGAGEDEGAHGGSHHDLPSFDLGLRFGLPLGRVAAGAGVTARGGAAASGVGSVGSQAGDVRPQHKPLRRLQRGSQSQAHASLGHESVGQLSGSCSQARSGGEEQAGAPDLLEDSEALLEDSMDAEGDAADVQSAHAQGAQPQSTQPQSAHAQSAQAQTAHPQDAHPQIAHPHIAHEQSAHVHSGQAGAGGVQVKPEPGLEGGRPVGPLAGPSGPQAQAARKGLGGAAAVVRFGGGAGAGAGGSGVGTESKRGAGAGGAGIDGVPSLASALASARAARSAAATPSVAGASAVRATAAAGDPGQLGGSRGGGAGKAAAGAGQGLTPVGALLRTLAEAAERASAARAAGRGGSGMDARAGGGLVLHGEGGGGGGIEVEVLKPLARPPRGNTVKEHHGLSVLKGLEWAEQVQVRGRGREGGREGQ